MYKVWFYYDDLVAEHHYETDPALASCRLGLVNILTYCPHCGDVWSRLITELDPGREAEVVHQWVSHARLCPKHGSGRILEHLIGMPPTEIVRTHPPELIRHEAEAIQKEKLNVAPTNRPRFQHPADGRTWVG